MIFNSHNSRTYNINQSATGTYGADLNRRITDIVQQKDALISKLHESFSRKVTAQLRKVHGRLFG